MDGGADLNMGGMCTYYHDLIYLAAFVQIASIFSERAWLCFAVVRAVLLVCRAARYCASHATVMDINPKYVHAGAGLCGVPAVGKCGAAILQVGVTAQGKIFASPSPCMQFLEIMCMPCPPLRRHM